MRVHSFVYFIQQGSDGPVKIGYALNPIRRLHVLQCGNPSKLELRAVYPGGAALERTLHRFFDDSRIMNEWFEPSADLLELMDNVDELRFWAGSNAPAKKSLDNSAIMS